tara:strand:- start:3249 stop:3446 length:198 start_codon:yes stop_codon:yes gene_type:complete
MDIETLKNKIKDLEKSQKEIDEKVSEISRRPIPNHMEVQRLRADKKQVQKQIKYIQEKLIPDIIA